MPGHSDAKAAPAGNGDSASASREGALTPA